MHSIPARQSERAVDDGAGGTPKSAPRGDLPVFTWKDFSRFVQTAPVERGWLVIWGHYRNMGQTRDLVGYRTYRDLTGARRRVADSVFELTRDPALVAEALVRFDHTPFPRHMPGPFPDPL